jgi:hypothetical protein
MKTYTRKPAYRKKRFVRKPLKSRKTLTKKPYAVATRAYVKKMIHNNIENKKAQDYKANESLNTALNPGAPATIFLLPKLLQGITGGSSTGRIGNEIRLVKGIISGFVNIRPYNASTNHLCTQLVKIWLLSYKPENATTTAQIDWAKYFEVGNTAAGFQTDPLDMLLNVNKDLFIVHETREFKLGTASQSSLTNGTAGQYFDNSPMTQKFYFNWGKYCKTKLKYDDNVSDQPTNRNFFICFQSVNADGSATNNKTPCEFHYVNNMEYEDA